MARSRCLPGGLDAVADDACAEGVKSDGAHEVQWPPPAGVVEKEVEVEVEMEVEVVETNLRTWKGCCLPGQAAGHSGHILQVWWRRRWRWRWYLVLGQQGDGGGYGGGGEGGRSRRWCPPWCSSYLSASSHYTSYSEMKEFTPFLWLLSQCSCWTSSPQTISAAE